MKWLYTWQFFALGSALFAGLTAVFGKVGVAQVNSNLATLLRTIVIIVILAAIVLWRGEWQPLHTIPTRSLAFLFLSALATGGSWLCYYRALQLGPASRVAPIDKLSVVVAMTLAIIFLGEALTWKTALGGLLVTAGAVVLALP
jgi:bacterial/archaeal transporter family protein